MGNPCLIFISNAIPRSFGYYNEDFLPFTIICDPKLTFYKQFDIQVVAYAVEADLTRTLNTEVTDE
ncbi:hypothetical protein [Sporomusa sp. KB1]|uniref:hypothetical protein n=1 Tax=Sporomusa sp. KB1 TaxID=943346 RepID=UPI0011A80527|nr:hypothetical protein [Sporomusa sp. KB1]TWH45867.1 hypothetical protein Salpa_1795 [Sporomusa sp. KB1]